MDEDEDTEAVATVEKTAEQLEEEKHGFLGKILRAIVVANTW